MDKFDIVGNVGFENFGGTLAVDAAANFAVYDFVIEKAKFDVTVGGGLALALPFDGSNLSLEAIIPVGLFYSMNNDDFPLDFYLRVGPTVRIIKGDKSILLGVMVFSELLEILIIVYGRSDMQLGASFRRHPIF